MDTKKLQIFTKKRFWAGLLLAQFLLFYAFSTSEILIGFFEKLFEFQKGLHQKLFAVFPFSIGDVFYISLGLYLIFFLISIFRKKEKKPLWIGFLMTVNLLYFIYQIFWGMLYFQKPLISKLPETEITLDLTKKLAIKYLELCKQTRAKVNEDQNGVFKIRNQNAIEAEILANQKLLLHKINSKAATQVNSFKPSLFKGIMSQTGIMGYYNPFTAEAQYNPELPSSQLPFTLSHESAHQMGYAREQEASFIGFLISENSKNADLRYSCEYFVLKTLLNSLVEKNPEFVKKMIQNYSPAMKRDRLAEIAFRKRNEGWISDFFGFTNDLFLKSNRQEGSVTYSYFADLLIRYESGVAKLSKIKKNRILRYGSKNTNDEKKLLPHQ